MSNLFTLKELTVPLLNQEGGNATSKQLKFVEAHSRKIENIKQLCGETPAPGEITFLWSCNSFNAFTFIPYVIKYSGLIDELCISTYSINTRIVEALVRWYDKGLIKHIYIYIADSIKFRMPAVVELLENYAQTRQIIICYAWNHSKIQLISSFGNYFVVEGSGNFSENAANEQYIFLNNKDIYEFRKQCFIDSGTVRRT